MTREEVIHSVQKLELADGDCVVITSNKPLSLEHRKALRNVMVAALSEMKCAAPVIVLDNGLDVKILKTSELERSDDA